MKLSTDTLKILENFISVNPAIVIHPGKKLVSMNIHNSVLASADIDEYIEYEMPIIDLKSFLQTLSLFDDPVITVDSDRYMTIKEDEGSTSCHYYFGNKTLINEPPVTELTLQNKVIEFSLPQKTLVGILKAAKVFRLEHIILFDKDGKIVLGVTNPDKPDQNTYQVEVGDWSGPEFKLYLHLDSLNILPGDYNVSVEVGEHKMFEFANANGKLSYWLSLDDNSYYG